MHFAQDNSPPYPRIRTTAERRVITMFGPSVRVMTMAAAVAAASVLAQMPANAQQDGSLVLKTGTTSSYEGVMVPEGGCGEYVPYQQFMKVSGHVILPETTANVYSFIEYWGRDSGIQVLRFSPNGNAFMYSQGKEYAFSMFAPVDTSYEIGESLRLVIVGNGITVTLPTGVVYDNLTQMDMYCINCGLDPVRMESRWYSREHPYGVLFRADNPGCLLMPRWHWLVSVTTK
jgi:hypothetical protein